MHIGKGCTCRRASCGFVFVGNITVDTSNHSNICAYGFVDITTRDIHWAVQSNYTLIQGLQPTSLGMSLTMVTNL